jgi:hypothetical protein
MEAPAPAPARVPQAAVLVVSEPARAVPAPEPARAPAAELVSTEGPEAAYLARLLDRGKRAYAEAVLAWRRGGEAGERPGWESIRGMTEVKALDVDRTIGRMGRRPSREDRAPAAPRPETPKRPARAPRRTREAEPAFEGPDPLHPSFEPLTWDASDPEAEGRAAWNAAYATGGGVLGGELLRKGVYHKKRAADALLALSREEMIRECARLEEALPRLSPAARKHAEERIAAAETLCDVARKSPIPWYGQSGKTAEAMTSAWRTGRLHFDRGAWLWRMGKAAGSSALHVYRSATGGTPYPLATAPELLAEMEAHQKNHSAVYAVLHGDEAKDRANAAWHARAAELVRRLNRAAPAEASVWWAWHSPDQHRRSSYVRATVQRLSPLEVDALRHLDASGALQAARAMDKLGSWQTEGHTHEGRPPYTSIETTIDRREASSHERVGQLASALAEGLRSLGYRVTKVEDQTPVRAQVAPGDVVAPSPRNYPVPWKADREGAAVVAVLGPKSASFYLHRPDPALAESLRQHVSRTWEHDEDTGVSAPIPVPGGYRIDAVTSAYGQPVSKLFGLYLWPDEHPIAYEVTPAAWSADPAYAKRAEEMIRFARTAAHHLERGYGVQRHAREPGLLDVWLRSERRSLLASGLGLIAFARRVPWPERSQPPEGAYEEIAAGVGRARRGDVAWKGLRAGSDNSRAVTAAIDRGELRPTEKYPQSQRHEWEYKGHLGPTAWEAFKAGGGAAA